MQQSYTRRNRTKSTTKLEDIRDKTKTFWYTLLMQKIWNQNITFGMVQDFVKMYAKGFIVNKQKITIADFENVQDHLNRDVP